MYSIAAELLSDSPALLLYEAVGLHIAIIYQEGITWETNWPILAIASIVVWRTEHTRCAF